MCFNLSYIVLSTISFTERLDQARTLGIIGRKIVFSSFFHAHHIYLPPLLLSLLMSGINCFCSVLLSNADQTAQVELWLLLVMDLCKIYRKVASPPDARTADSCLYLSVHTQSQGLIQLFLSGNLLASFLYSQEIFWHVGCVYTAPSCIRN